MILLFMFKIKLVAIIVLSILVLTSCQTVSNKIDEKAALEEKELSKWLNQPETELKIVLGKPDKIESLGDGAKLYIYVTEKLKIKCTRKFEINSKNMITGFSSKNCF